MPGANDHNKGYSFAMIARQPGMTTTMAMLISIPVTEYPQ